MFGGFKGIPKGQPVGVSKEKKDAHLAFVQPPWDGGPGGGLEATDHPNILRLLEIFEDAASSAFFSAKAAIFQRPSIWWFGARRAGVVSHLPSAKPPTKGYLIVFSPAYVGRSAKAEENLV